MANKRRIEIFSAGCPACEQAIELVRTLVWPFCEVIVRDMNDSQVTQRAHQLGIRQGRRWLSMDSSLAAAATLAPPKRRCVRQGSAQRNRLY